MKPICIEVMTSNDDPKGGGFHEINTFKYLSSPKHAVACVHDMIRNNRVFSPDTNLDSLIISCTDDRTIAELELANFGRFYEEIKHLEICKKDKRDI